MTTIFLVDIVWQGHVATYHKYFAKVLLEAGYRIISISPDPIDVATWMRTNAPHVSHSLQCKSFYDNEGSPQAVRAGEGSRFLNALKLFYRSKWTPVFIRTIFTFILALRLWHRTDRLIGNYRDTHQLQDSTLVFFPYIDFRFLHDFLSPHILDRLFHFHWAALYLHPTFLLQGTRPSTVHGRPDAIFYSRYCAGIAVLDETLVERLRDRIKKPVVWFPDITDTNIGNQLSDISKRIIQKADGKKIALLIGALSQKKNLTTFLRTAELCLEKELPFFFVVAGDIDFPSWDHADRDYIESVIIRSPSNVYFHLRGIPEGPEYNSLFLISDIIYAAYNSFYHSSNSLTKASFFKKPVIVSDTYLMSKRVRLYRTGLAVSDQSAPTCLDAILRAADHKDHFDMPLDPQFTTYSSMHSLPALRKAFSDLLISINQNMRDTVRNSTQSSAETLHPEANLRHRRRRRMPTHRQP